MRRKKDKSNGITALYERLSRDDDNAGESNSIVHQKQMLEDYAMKHGFTNLVHFTDDGWSGATFDRPSWNRLVEGVKNGEITACICKDMSRIGRDHLQVGFFTDILFREKEVRFIAINNGIDSDRQETSEFAPFLNIMNEWFVRDTSKKIKAVLKSRGSSGNAHTSNIPPYGYLKDPENPDHWIIDEEAAEVVRRIYRMTIEGKGPYQIARELSEEKIERPSYYLGKKGLGNHASNYDKENPYMWRGNQVTTLIARPEYIGKTVNFRTFKNSYKDKKTKRADKEDWVVFDDTQEPIVDEETWLLAQKLRQNVRKADPMGEPNVLTGKIYCADCGAPMYNHRQRKGRERIYYTAKGEKRTSYSNPADCYECSTYNLAYQKYDRHCTCHHISTKALKSIILKTIQETCHYVSLNEREFVYSLQEESAMKDIAVSETVKNRIERNQKRVHELDMLIRKIYEDNVIGRLPDRLFQSMLTDYENEQNELNKIKLYILNENQEVMESWTSGDQPHYVEKLSVGTYTLLEETAPKGYIVANKVTFEVKDTGDVQGAKMEDEQAMGKVILNKTDKDTKKPMKGVEFALCDSKGKVLETLVTDSAGHAESKNYPIATFKNGQYKKAITYILKETKTLDGYQLDETEHKIQFEYVNDRTPVIEYTLDLTNKKAPEKDTPETSENQGVSTPGSHGSDATSVSNSPKTGDNTNIAIFVLALAVSAGCLGTVVTVKRKRK